MKLDISVKNISQANYFWKNVRVKNLILKSVCHKFNTPRLISLCPWMGLQSPCPSTSAFQCWQWCSQLLLTDRPMHLFILRAPLWSRKVLLPFPTVKGVLCFAFHQKLCSTGFLDPELGLDFISVTPSACAASAKPSYWCCVYTLPAQGKGPSRKPDKTALAFSSCFLWLLDSMLWEQVRFHKEKFQSAKTPCLPDKKIQKPKNHKQSISVISKNQLIPRSLNFLIFLMCNLSNVYEYLWNTAKK